jgi:hypothetical protein
MAGAVRSVSGRLTGAAAWAAPDGPPPQLALPPGRASDPAGPHTLDGAGGLAHRLVGDAAGRGGAATARAPKPNGARGQAKVLKKRAERTDSSRRSRKPFLSVPDPWTSVNP